MDQYEQEWRTKVNANAYPMTFTEAVATLKQWEKDFRCNTGMSYHVHRAMLNIIDNLEKPVEESQQFVQVRKVLEFADCLDKWADTIRNMIHPPGVSERKQMAVDVSEFSQALRQCVCPDRKQEYKATMYVWNGGGSTALYDDDERVWLGGLLTIADAMRAFGWDFERIEIDRDDLCGKAPPMSLKEMQELLAGVERQKKRERLAELREELADLEKELEGTK